MRTYYRFTWWVPKWGGPEMVEDRLKSSTNPSDFYYNYLVPKYGKVLYLEWKEILK